MHKKLTHKNTNTKTLTIVVRVVLRRQKLKYPPERERATKRGIEGSEGRSGERKNRQVERESSSRTEREFRRDKRRERREREIRHREGETRLEEKGDGDKVRLCIRERRGR